MPADCSVLVLNERDPRHPAAGGAEVHVAEMFGRLAKSGFKVTLATSSFRGARAREEIAGLDVRRLGPLPIYYPRVAAFCATETRKGNYDLVVECLNKVPFYAPVYSRVPVLALCHHLFGEVAFQQVAWPIAATVWAAEKLVPPLYRRRPFVTISESSRQDLIARGVLAANIQVIHCGIEPPAFLPDTQKPRPPRVVYLGRLEPYKNVDVVLKAMAALPSELAASELLVIGRGSAEASLRELAGRLGLAERTHFVGFVSNEERDKLLAESRVCVCASSKEGWGLTVIEANALGTPVVATDAPGLRDSVQDGRTGFLVAEKDVASFAERIARLLSDDTLATRMSHAAYEWSQRFDWDSAANELAQSLRRTLEPT